MKHADALAHRGESSFPPIPRRFRAVMMDKVQYIWGKWREPQIHGVVCITGRILDDRVGKAVRLSLDAERVLGCRFVNRWWRPYWEHRDDLDNIEFYEVIETANVEKELQRFLSTPTGPCEDPQVLVRILRSGDDTLCIKVSHIVADAVGVTLGRHAPRFAGTS